MPVLVAKLSGIKEDLLSRMVSSSEVTMLSTKERVSHAAEMPLGNQQMPSARSFVALRLSVRDCVANVEKQST